MASDDQPEAVLDTAEFRQIGALGSPFSTFIDYQIRS
jgi:hypothetical protein